ncbi:hypothetical protein [Mycobacteroides abscessus]|uniref:hypothetical protein n=1 Tax=Mycobacteroides abscessus TaxID=36809 RepID=UPI001F4317A8|nr:hypothetical protein [Mycobacteroides abscessus]
MPSYDPGRGQPPLDQNNGISIYNSAAPQPSQAAQPSQAPVQNQDGSYNRAANGEQQPNQYNNAPNNQQLNNNWQKLSDQLNQNSNEQENTQKRDSCADLSAAYMRYSAIQNPSEQVVGAVADLLEQAEMSGCSADAANNKCVPVEGKPWASLNPIDGVPVTYTDPNGKKIPTTANGYINIYYDSATGNLSVEGTLVGSAGGEGKPVIDSPIPLHGRPGDAIAIPVKWVGTIYSGTYSIPTVEICDRTRDGKFAGASGYAKSSEDIGIGQFLSENAQMWHIMKDDSAGRRLAQLDSPTPNTANGRYFDGIVCSNLNPTDCMGLEVKSGGAKKSAGQDEFDKAVSATNPARVTYLINGIPQNLVVTRVAPVIYVP